MSGRRKRHLTRFAALLLFQWRAVGDRQSRARRLCEQRMLNFTASSGRSALAEARKRGRAAQFRYRNDEGNPVHFEFVGVLDLLDLGAECDPDEVWYDIVRVLKPMERRKELVPRADQLTAISWGSKRPNRPLQRPAARPGLGRLRKDERRRR